ncbi:MAG TPA: GAF domain-containing protein [Herpetosiphonaceae bacterium]
MIESALTDEQRLERARTELDVLYQFGLATHAGSDAAPLYRLLFDQAGRLLPFDAGFISLLTPGRDRLQNTILIDEGAEQPIDPPRTINEHGPTAWAIRHQQPVRFAEYYDELPARFPHFGADVQFGDPAKQPRSWMIVPMLVDQRVEGVINMQCVRPGQYGEREERLLTTLGSMLAIAVNQSGLVRELEAMRAALSAPLIPVSQQVLILPLIGRLDQERLDLVQRALLGTVERQRVRHVLLDLTGLTELGGETPRRLVRLVRAVGLLGASCLLSGLRAELAQALAGIDRELAGVAVVRDVEQGLARFGALRG